MEIPAGFPSFRQSNIDQSECLFRFNAMQLQGKKEPPSAFASRGTEVHKLHKLYVDYLVRSGQEYDFQYGESLITPAIGQEAAGIWRSYFPREIIEPGAVYGTEVKLCLDAEMNPCAEGGHAFSGEFDRLEIRGTDATIWDMKTNWMIYLPSETIQGRYYAWLTHKSLPHVKNFRFELSFVRWGVSRFEDFDVSDIERIEREEILPKVQRILDANAKNEWPATPMKACSYCSLACPLMEDFTAEQLGRIENREAAAMRLYVWEKRAAKLKEQLKASCVEYGPISVGDKYQLGFQKRVTQEYNVSFTRALNEEYGFDKNRALVVDNQEIKRVAKKYPEFKTRLEKTKKDSSTTIFGFRNEEEE